MSTIARLSLEEYDRMIESGVFDRTVRRRLEFIKGEIREMNPIGSMHEVVVDRLNEWSIQGPSRGKSLGSGAKLHRAARTGKRPRT